MIEPILQGLALLFQAMASGPNGFFVFVLLFFVILVIAIWVKRSGFQDYGDRTRILFTK